MENNKNLDLGNAMFSVAMIDLKTHTETLKTIDKKLEEANFLLNYVLKKNEQSEEMVKMLKDLAFPEYAKVQRYLKDLKALISKHMKKLEDYLTKNLDKNAEFYAQLDILIPLFEEKEKFVNEQIQKCFEYFKANCENVSLEVE